MEAIYIMLAEADRFTDPTLELHIAERDDARYQLLRTIIPVPLHYCHLCDAITTELGGAASDAKAPGAIADRIA